MLAVGVICSTSWVQEPASFLEGVVGDEALQVDVAERVAGSESHRARQDLAVL